MSSFASDEFIEVYQPQKGGAIGEWVLVGQMSAAGAEAEIWRAHSATNANHEAILKFYRYGHAPSLLPSVLQSLDQENIVKTLATGTIQGRPYEVIEYFPERGLDRLLEKSRKLSEANCLRLLEQMTQGLLYLQNKGLQHRDIKPSNILVRGTEPLSIVLSDFGGAQAGGMTTRLTQTIGTLMYAAPELATGMSSKASDWWSVGMVVLEALSGHHPFADLDQRHLHFMIAAGKVELPTKISAPWAELFSGLLNPNYKDRWQGRQILAWVQRMQNPSYAEELAVANRRNQKTDTGTNLPRDGVTIVTLTVMLGVGLLLMVAIFETEIYLKDAHLKAAGPPSPSQEVAPATHTLTQVAPAVKSPAPILRYTFNL